MACKDINSLQLAYQTALSRHLRHAATGKVHPARRLGRQAMTLGLETLELALIHDRAMPLANKDLPVDSPSARHDAIKRAGEFFAEAILPMEETHLAAMQTNRRLGELNKDLSRRTTELSAANRQLKQAIKKRQAVEESLRKSEQHTTHLLKQSQRLQEQLRRLSRRVLSTQEDERKRISRELHDVIAQMLTGINVRLTTLKMEATASTKGLSRKITSTQRLVAKSADIVHRFARELRPAVLDDLGLIPAIHAVLKDFGQATGMRVSMTACAEVEKLSSTKRTTLFRVVQEALSNVSRHAQAAQVKVKIKRLPKAIAMQIKDDGKSFDVDRVWRAKKSQRLGLLGMRERMEMIGGKFEVISAPGRGTTILATVPCATGTRERISP